MRSIVIGMARLMFTAFLTLGGASCSAEETEGDYGSSTAEQEVALGLQVAPALAERYGGLLDAPDQRMIDLLGELGQLVSAPAKGAGLPFGVAFYVLADSVHADVLSLPGGQVFITYGMLRRFGGNMPGIAALLAHELGHVTARHAILRVSELRFDGQSGAAVLARYSPEDQRSRTTPAVRGLIAALLDVRYTEVEEMEADRRAVEYLRGAAADTLLLPDGTPVTGVADPAALAPILRQLVDSGGDGTASSRFLTRHPVTTPRLMRLAATINNPY